MASDPIRARRRTRRMRAGATTSALLLAPLLMSACGSATAAVDPTPARPGASAAQARVDAFATVAQRLYAEEAYGPTGRLQLARIARDGTLLRALEAGDRAAVRAEALHQLFLPGFHVVRIKIVKRGRTLTDVGGRFVAAAESRELKAPDGADLGRLEISMQDILGLTKLVERFTGAGIVVHGRAGHVQASSPAFVHARIPASGRVDVAGRTYVARSFQRKGWGGELLRISVLDPD